MNIAQPTESEILGVLRRHPGKFLRKRDIAREIAKDRGIDSSLVGRAANELRTMLRNMRLRDIPRIRRAQTH